MRVLFAINYQYEKAWFLQPSIFSHTVQMATIETIGIICRKFADHKMMFLESRLAKITVSIRTYFQANEFR